MENLQNNITDFIDAHDDTLPPEVLEEVRTQAHAAGLPFYEKPYNGEDIDPYVYDGRMSFEDYELMHKMISQERSEKVLSYSSYDHDRLDAADKLRIERSIYFESEKADISGLTALPVGELIKQREESAAAEQAIFEALKEQAAAWEAQAGKTLSIDKAIEYARTPAVKHTSNEWETDEYGHHRRSNSVYQMRYHISENTRYDRQAEKSVPYSYTLTWSVYTNSPDGYRQAKIAGQDRKVFSDKAAMEKYLNGRIKAYQHLFTELSPPIPPEYASNFKVNGKLLPGYTIEGEERAPDKQAAAPPEQDATHNPAQRKERETMGEQFSILIDSRSRFETGQPGGTWLSMPATKEQLHEAMESVGITAENPQDFFIRGYFDNEDRHIALPYDMVCASDVDSLNFLAARLEQLDPAELGKLNAALQQKQGFENIGQVIDFTYNVDYFVHIPEVQTSRDLGDYYLNKSGMVEMPEEWKAGIDLAAFGKNAAEKEQGAFTPYGYIVKSGDEWQRHYEGRDVPEEHRIMSFPQPERPDPEKADFDAITTRQAATLTAEPPEPRPVIPIVLTSEKPAEKLKEITDRLEQGIKELFDSERYKEYLRVMSKFHNYSFNNTLLIAMQKPDASLVAGFSAWKNNFQRNVVKGEKGIKIIAPSPFKIKQEMDKIDPATNKPVMGADGKPVKEEKEITIPAFKVVSVFDVSQTEGKELTDIAVDTLTGDVERFKDVFAALEKTSPVPIGFEKIEGGAHGYYHLEEKRIAIDEGMSELQTLKTAIHEIAHAKLHDIDLNAPKEEQQDRPDRRTREVQAESVAYAVCQHYGLDTSDYSFGYVAGWSSGRELDELKSSLETIRATAAEIINSIDGYLQEIQKEREAQQTAEQETPVFDKLTPEKQTELSDSIKAMLQTLIDADMQAHGEVTDGTLEAISTQGYFFHDGGLTKADPAAEPTVTVIWSENNKLRDGQTMPLSEADKLFASLDEANKDIPGYDKTAFRIDFVMNGKADSYEGRQDFGDGDGGLIAHIESYHAYYANNPDWDNYLLRNKGKEALDADKAQREMLLHEFVPYLKLHTNLSEMEQAASAAMRRGEDLTQTETAYYTVLQQYVSDCRGALNQGSYELPPVPQLADFDVELQAYKQQVREEIAQEAASAGMTVEEYAANGYEPYSTLPDPTISVSDMHSYGYSWEGMLPLQQEAAERLFHADLEIFRIYEDGTEGAITDLSEVREHAEKGGLFGVEKAAWEAFKERSTEQAQEEAKNAPEAAEPDKDTFSIYQLKRGDETRDLRFEPYDRLIATGHTVDMANYDLIYTADLTPGMTFGSIWETFNIDHPKDFKGHSLSVSDIVVLHQNGQDTAHYVDSIGYQQVPEFLQPKQEVTLAPDDLVTGEQITTPRGNFHVTAMTREQMEAAGYGFHHQSEDGKHLIMGNGTRAFAVAAEQPEKANPLKHVEDTIEQNDNIFDGLINNTPQTPTVDALEQKAKSGEPISLTELADAIKADKQRGGKGKEEKPSIRAQLKAGKEKTAPKKAAKAKNHDLEV